MEAKLKTTKDTIIPWPGRNPPPPCGRCNENTWFGIPDSLAIACCKCGFVYVEGGSDGWEVGATLQEWAADLAENARARDAARDASS